MTRKFFFLIAPAALLSACDDPEPVAETATEQGSEAAGEVLGGTISDDMIALDQLTSASPPAEPAVSSEGDSASGPRSSEAGTAPETAPEPDAQEAEPAPADPAPEAAPPPAE